MKPINNTIVFAGLTSVLGIVAACSNGSGDMTQAGKGAVQIVMSSSATAPITAAATTDDGSTGGSTLQSANVTFSSILARNLEGQLISVAIDLPVTADLLGLVDNGSLTLPAGLLPPGSYDQIVIVITKLELTLMNGTVVTIEPPGGGWTSIVRVTDTFVVAEGQTTTVNIRFRPDRSLRWVDGRWRFDPQFDCDGGDDEDDD